MKKKLLNFLSATIVLLCGINVNAADFSVQGLFFSVVSPSDLTCKVVKGESLYAGDIVVPGSVSHDGKTYKVVAVDEKAFSDCIGLTSVSVPASVEKIGDNAFLGCKALARVSIEDGESTLTLGSNDKKKGLFNGCPLKSLHLGRNISYTADKAHGYSPCLDITSLKEVTFGDKVTTIGRSLLCGCTGLTAIVFPERLERIEDLAFQECSGLVDVKIPNQVTKIGDLAFQGCTGMTTLVVGDAVKLIGGYSFSNCEALTTVTIGVGIDSIADEAFSNCKNITKVTALNPVACRTSIVDMRYVFDDNAYANATLFVPKGSLDSYKKQFGWKQFDHMQELDPQSSVEQVLEQEIAIEACNGNLTIDALAANAQVEIFTLDGKVAYRGNEAVIALPTQAIYIVKTMGKVFKVAL